MGDIKACTHPLMKISHMLQSDGSTKLPEPPGSGSSAIKTECCPCRNAFRKEGTKDSVEEIYWLPCNSQCKPITFPIWPANRKASRPKCVAACMQDLRPTSPMCDFLLIVG